MTISDPGLDAAVRAALLKPTGPLSDQDLLALTALNASSRNITNLQGLEAAHNLTSLNLRSNQVANLAFPIGLAKLSSLDLSFNPLTNCIFPNELTNLNSLVIYSAQLTNLTLPATLPKLGQLVAYGNRLTTLGLPAGMSQLGFLDLSANQLANLTLPAGLTGLTQIELYQNQLRSLTLPADLTNVIGLDLFSNQLTNLSSTAELRTLVALDLHDNQFTRFDAPPGLTRLNRLDLGSNQLLNVTLPAGMTNLNFLFLNDNQLANVGLPADLTALNFLRLDGNQLTNVTLSEGHSQLSGLFLSRNRFTSFALPGGLTNLTSLTLADNQLTNVVFPSDLSHLVSLDLSGNQLTRFTVPAGLKNLFGLFLNDNQLTNITLPPDLLRLGALGYVGNPLTTFVLSEPLAATNLRDELQAIRNLGVEVFTYPLEIRLTELMQPVGAFRFGITGPPGFYTVLSSTNLTDWSVLDVANNPLGGVFFLDPTAQFSPQKFYRAQSLTNPPANMVFVPANTFLLGSPSNEVGHQADESPQTIVRLSRGYWIGKYEVTQREYLAVTGENPSSFSGDLDRPVESVSFFAASNYCFQLTQRDLAAGRIPSGTHYRLPTEAQWECAARAGNTNRFYSGDDPSLTNLTKYAWFGAHNGITTHPVGQKLPNAWGLYDMEGNVWEWCQDWYGNYPGGTVTDPEGPATNPIGWKVIRGGAWESSEFDCRSASRWFEGASPFVSDFIIGFRVVLVTDP